MNVLVLLRHGQAQWNVENRFTGWMDIALTPQGEKDAATVASVLGEYHFDMGFTSLLQRAKKTLEIVLQTSGQTQMPIQADSALNERNYGDLQGLNKAETAAQYGQEQVRLWRRSFFTRPPNGESMHDCERRTLPFFKQYILPLVQDGKNIIVTAHGNSLRPIIKFLDELGPDAASSMEIGLCTPYIYTYDNGNLVKREVKVVAGIVTKGSSTTEKLVKEGNL